MVVFLVVFFAAGDASVEADDVFFVVVFFELVVAEDVVVAASSFFWLWQPRNAANVSAVITDKTDVFIVVKLNEDRECRSSSRRASLKIVSFFFQTPRFFS